MTKYWGAEFPIEADVKFAILMSCEYSYSEKSPMLKSGTVVSDQSGTYYICIQPPCDCIRIDDKRPFIFAPLENTGGAKDKNFNLVCILKNKIQYLRYIYKSYKIKSVIFSPSQQNGSVYAQKSGKAWNFISVDNKKFKWIMQLKEVHALRAIQEYSVNLSRIGLTESDWLRRCGR